MAAPIVCTLTGNDSPAERVAEFQRELARLERTEPLEDGFRWVFRDAPGLEARLQDLARREHECCQFFRFRVAREGDSIVWETRAPAEAAGVVEQLMRLPETIGRDLTVETLKKMFTDAGLRFV